MSTTSNLITAAVLFGPGLTGGAAVLRSQRGWRTDAAAVATVLAESAAERAAATDAGQHPVPPQGGEPAPDTVPAPVVHLAVVLDFPAHRRAA